MAQTHQPKDLHQGQKTHLICQEALSDFLFLVYPWLRSSPLFAPPSKKKKEKKLQPGIKPMWSAVGWMQKDALGIYCAFYQQRWVVW